MNSTSFVDSTVCIGVEIYHDSTHASANNAHNLNFPRDTGKWELQFPIALILNPFANPLYKRRKKND